MAVDKRFLIKDAQTRENMIVAYCGYTNMPLVTCDPETFNDQIWIFESNELLQEFAKPYIAKKIVLKGVQYPNKAFLSFYSMLFNIGVNELVYVGKEGTQSIELTELIKKPDFSKLPPQQRPITNPELQLTGLYFMQEAGRPVPQEEKEGIAELEEELAANLVKGKYLVPVELLEGPETPAEKLQNKKFKLPLLKMKNEDKMVPIFSDPTEMSKFNRENKFISLGIPFDKLDAALPNEAKGFMLNPGGFHITMPRELLASLKVRFDVK